MTVLPGIFSFEPKAFGFRSSSKLKSQGQFVKDDKIVFNISGRGCRRHTLAGNEVIAGKQITSAYHVRKVTGNLISRDNIHFPTIISLDKTRRKLIGFGIGNRRHNV